MKSLRYQQGDVLLYVINELPSGCAEVESKNHTFTLAEGEATGHAHRITVDTTDLSETTIGGVKMFKSDDGTLYLSIVEAPVPLTHEEHGHITIEPGLYEIGIVREIDPFENEIRSVQD